MRHELTDLYTLVFTNERLKVNVGTIGGALAVNLNGIKELASARLAGGTGSPTVEGVLRQGIAEALAASSQQGRGSWNRAIRTPIELITRREVSRTLRGYFSADGPGAALKLSTDALNAIIDVTCAIAIERKLMSSDNAAERIIVGSVVPSTPAKAWERYGIVRLMAIPNAAIVEQPNAGGGGGQVRGAVVTANDLATQLTRVLCSPKLVEVLTELSVLDDAPAYLKYALIEPPAEVAENVHGGLAEEAVRNAQSVQLLSAMRDKNLKAKNYHRSPDKKRMEVLNGILAQIRSGGGHGGLKAVPVRDLLNYSEVLSSEITLAESGATKTRVRRIGLRALGLLEAVATPRHLYTQISIDTGTSIFARVVGLSGGAMAVSEPGVNAVVDGPMLPANLVGRYRSIPVTLIRQPGEEEISVVGPKAAYSVDMKTLVDQDDPQTMLKSMALEAGLGASVLKSLTGKDEKAGALPSNLKKRGTEEANAMELAYAAALSQGVFISVADERFELYFRYNPVCADAEAQGVETSVDTITVETSSPYNVLRAAPLEEYRGGGESLGSAAPLLGEDVVVCRVGAQNEFFDQLPEKVELEALIDRAGAAADAERVKAVYSIDLATLSGIGATELKRVSAGVFQEWGTAFRRRNASAWMMRWLIASSIVQAEGRQRASNVVFNGLVTAEGGTLRSDGVAAEIWSAMRTHKTAAADASVGRGRALAVIMRHVALRRLTGAISADTAKLVMKMTSNYNDVSDNALVIAVGATM